MATYYARAKAKDPFMDASKMNAGASLTRKLSSGKEDERKANASLMVHNVDELSSCTKAERILNKIGGKIHSLSALIMSQPDAVLLCLAKALSVLVHFGA